jgi:hypothetical protein
MQAQAQATKNGAGGKAMQTGPKGVKADYEQAKKDWAEIRYQQNLQHQLNIDRITHGVTIVEFEDEAPPPEGHTIELNQYESDDDELLEGFEEDFMAQYASSSFPSAHKLCMLRPFPLLLFPSVP